MKVRLNEQGKNLIKDFAKFGKHLIASKDIDPLYPVLKELHSIRQMDMEQALWHTFLYVAWYNLPSGEAAFEIAPHPTPKLLDKFDKKWPTGIERRNHRGGRVDIHIASYLHAVEKAGSQRAWWVKGLKKNVAPTENWKVLFERLQTLSGNGRWAAYKHCEILMKVHGFPIAAPDMGNQFSSGPRHGLDLLFDPVEGDGPAEVALLDEEGWYLHKGLAKMGLDMGIEELETILCNFNSLYKGRYYVGHDIDELQEQITKAGEEERIGPRTVGELWKARRLSLPKHYLGEFGGWEGIDKKRQKAYSERGKILIRKPRGRHG